MTGDRVAVCARPPVGADRAAALAEPVARALVRRALVHGPLEIEARGASMRPWLHPGDRVRLEARPPRVGDVALAVVRGRLVLHRLRRRRGGHWLLRGDARPRPDGWIARADVLAVVVAHARADRPWRRFDAPWRRLLGWGAAPLVDALRRARRGATPLGTR